MSYPQRVFIPVKNKSTDINLFPPDETTKSNLPKRAFRSNFSISKYLLFPFGSIKIKLSVTDVISLMLLLLGSRASVIFDFGNCFFREIRVGRKNISSPIPPKFIARIFLKSFAKTFYLRLSGTASGIGADFVTGFAGTGALAGFGAGVAIGFG